MEPVWVNSCAQLRTVLSKPKRKKNLSPFWLSTVVPAQQCSMLHKSESPCEWGNFGGGEKGPSESVQQMLLTADILQIRAAHSVRKGEKENR
uniref:HDC02694 n=1 Tax=Drosophila melanogaster TaxID=7227 RepID=Q6IHE3_DROME|nr:TPA_inf: HDC02694 [Drosophila melanogaster]